MLVLVMWRFLQHRGKHFQLRTSATSGVDSEREIRGENLRKKLLLKVMQNCGEGESV